MTNESIQSFNKSFRLLSLKNQLHPKDHPAQTTTHAAIRRTYFAVTPATTIVFLNLVFNGGNIPRQSYRGAVCSSRLIPAITEQLTGRNSGSPLSNFLLRAEPPLTEEYILPSR